MRVNKSHTKKRLNESDRSVEELGLDVDDLYSILYYIDGLNVRRVLKYLHTIEDQTKPVTTEFLLKLHKWVGVESNNISTLSKSRIKESIMKRLTDARTTYLRPFREDDYYTFAGANPLPDGSAPMIYEDESGLFTVVLSGSDDESNCVITVLLGEDAEYAYYTPTDVDPSIAEANHIINDLIEEDNPEMYLEDPESGFEKVL